MYIVYVYVYRTRVAYFGAQAHEREIGACILRGRGNKKKERRNRETRSAKPEAPLQHGSLTYPQFTSDYYALYTYAAFLSRLSLSLPPHLFRLPFSSAPLYPICRGLPRRGNRGKYRFKMIPDR